MSSSIKKRTSGKTTDIQKRVTETGESADIQIRVDNTSKSTDIQRRVDNTCKSTAIQRQVMLDLLGFLTEKDISLDMKRIVLILKLYRILIFKLYDAIRICYWKSNVYYRN